MARNLTVNIQGQQTLSKALNKIQKSLETTNKSLDRVDRSLTQFSMGLNRGNNNVNQLRNSTLTATPAMTAFGSSVSRAGNKATKAAGQIGFLDAVMEKTSVSAGALSINVGAFTIALRQAQTQVPLIVTTLGSLISVIGGVATAAAAAGGALTGFLAGGAIAALEGIESQFSDVNNTSEALQKLMKGLGKSFRQALDPLVNQKNMEFFFNFLDGIVNLTNRAAQSISNVRDEVMTFFSTITDAGDFNDLAGSMENLFVSAEQMGGPFDTAGEALARFLAFIVDGLPAAIDFMNEATANLAAPLRDIGLAFLDLTETLVEFAQGAGKGFIDVIVILIDLFTTFFSAVNELSGSLSAAAIKTFALTAVALRLASAFDTVFLLGGKLSETLTALSLRSGNLADAFIRLSVLGRNFMMSHASGLTIFASKMASTIPILNRFNGAFAMLSATNADDELLFDTIGKQAAFVKGQLTRLLPSVSDVQDSIRQFGKMDGLAGALASGMDPAINKMGKAFDKNTGQFISAPSIQTGSFMKKLQPLTDGLKSAGKTAINTGKRIAIGIGQVGVGGLAAFSTAIGGLLHAPLGQSQAFIDAFNMSTQMMADGLRKLGLGPLVDVASGLKTMSLQLLGSAKSFVIAQLASIKFAFTQFGVVAGLKATAMSALASMKAVLSFAASMLLAAANAIILNISLGGIPILIGAIVVAASLLVGAIGNLDGVTKGAKSSFEGLKKFAVALGDALLGLLVPTFNVVVSVIGAILSPVFAIVDGFKLLIDAIVGSFTQAEEGSSLMETFGSVMDVLGSIVGAIAPIFDFIGDILFDAFILPFRIIAEVLGFTIPLFVKFINILNQFGNESGLFGGIVDAVTLVRDSFAGFIDFLTGALNDVIDIANVIPGVNIGEVGGAGGMTQKIQGAKITEDDVRENLQSDSKEAGPSQANTTQPNINVENNVNNTANVDAESNEKEQRIKTLVDRALSEADTRRRRAATGR